MPTRPNIVLVITDDQGYGDLACHGNPWVETPELDAFHAESVRFTDYHVGPTCAPTRSGLLTGHYANSTGVWHTNGGRSLLRADEWTLADALGEAGYATAIFGKWHLGDNHPYRPHDRGFQTAVVHGGGCVTGTPDYWGNDYFDDTYFANGEPREFSGYCTDVFFQEAIGWLRERRDRPFFLYLPTNAPHMPYNVPREYHERYAGNPEIPDYRARFYGMITNISENFGRLRRELRDLGLEENTILMFMTDNGTSAGVSLDNQGFVTDGFGAAMRGKKASPYEGGHRVPWFVRWPEAGFGGGQDIQTIAANVDFMPTMLDLCGVDPESHTFHGRSLRPLLEATARANHGAGPAGDSGFAAPIDWPVRHIVTDSQRNVRPVKWKHSSVMSDEWRLINGKELYGIADDPEQRVDLSADHPELVERMRGEYERWWEIVGEDFDEDIPISLGHDDEWIEIDAHDWRNESGDGLWHQGMIRRGHRENGFWEVEIARAGTYEFELRRWPREAGHRVVGGIEGPDITFRRDETEPAHHWWYEGGTEVLVKAARVSIQGVEGRTEVRPDDRSAVIRLPLKPGGTHLQTWFETDGGDDLGAYYIYVRRLATEV